MSPFFANVKRYRLLFGPFFAKFWLMLKNATEIGCSAHSYRQKKSKQKLRCYYLGQVGVIIWAK